LVNTCQPPLSTRMGNGCMVREIFAFTDCFLANAAFWHGHSFLGIDRLHHTRA
jgi:hypothetical protein